MTVKPSLSSLHSANSIGEPTREPLPDSVGANSSSGSASVKNNYQPIKAQRPKPVNQWTVYDVQKWLRKTCSEYYSNYSIKFLEQDITGRSLVRLTENSLLRLEIVIPEHRQAILREIAKLRLRGNILLLKDMEMREVQTQSQQ